jgi:CheY-specific phosphatase CheX
MRQELVEKIVHEYDTACEQYFESKLGFDVESYEGEEGYHGDMVSAAMIITFPEYTALLRLSLSEVIAETVVSKLTGLDILQIDDHLLFDGVGEVLNVVTGSVKRDLKENDYKFDMTPPFIVTGSNLKIHFKPGVSEHVHSYLVGGHYIEIEMAIIN